MQGMQVIGAGFGRTGTMSLKSALETLGLGPCHHMFELFNIPERAPLWEAAWRGEPVNWDQMLAGFHSTVDWPSAQFYAELAEAYPEAKVVLTVRDPEAWYQSCLKTIARERAEQAQITHLDDPVGHLNNTVIWEGVFGGRFREEKNRTIEIFEQHNREVRERIPPERLLIYDVKQGWEPLCHFLDLPVPDKSAFPHVNTTDEFLSRRIE